MSRRTLGNQRGNILLFTVILVLPLMLIFAGLAMDMAYFGSVDTDLQKAMDSAALAGAGKLGFSTDEFPTARAAAQQYANLHTYKAGNISLNSNDGNDPSGDIVLGIWDPTARTFTPSLDGNLVNAVQTRFSTAIPTSLLRVIGVNSLGASATAIGWAPPPTIPPTCPFPIALTWDPLNFPPIEGGGGGGTPPGNWLCGKPVRFTPTPLNSAGWANMEGCGNPKNGDITDWINQAGGNTCPSPIGKGTYIGLDNGLKESIVKGTLVPKFVEGFNASDTLEITQTDQTTGESTTIYNGKGWKVSVPVIDPDTIGPACPPPPVSWAPSRGTLFAWLWGGVSCAFPSVNPAFGQPVNRNAKVVGWTQFVMTQVIDKGDCTVDNPNDDVNRPFWPQPPHCAGGTGPSKDPSLVGIYGYYKCELSDTPGSPGAVASLGRPKLVK